jgi:hypothetical protein
VVEPEVRGAGAEAGGTPAERADCCITAFTDGTADGFWLGAKHGIKGSSHGVVYEVEWYDEVGGTFELWDDGLDLMKGSKFRGSNLEGGLKDFENLLKWPRDH